MGYQRFSWSCGTKGILCPGLPLVEFDLFEEQRQEKGRTAEEHQRSQIGVVLKMWTAYPLAAQEGDKTR